MSFNNGNNNISSFDLKVDSICESIKILKNVLLNNAFINIELNHTKDKTAIKIVKTVMENYFNIQFILEYLQSKKIKNNQLPIMYVGICLIKFLNYTSSQVCNYYVEILKKFGKSAIYDYCVFIFNKVENGEIVYPKEKSSKYQEIKYNYPSWIIGLIKKDYPSEFEKILTSKSSKYKHVRISLKENKNEILKLLDVKKVTETGAFINVNEAAKRLVIEGKITYMSLGSTYLCDLINVKENQLIFDTCAAPGGKSVFFAEKGLIVTSSDIYDSRLELIKSYANRMGVKLNIIKSDATIFNKEFEKKFDIVFCDVPCSGLGVMNEKYDIMLNRTYDDILSLSDVQFKILENTCKYVKDNGLLVYSTCTLTKIENDKNVSKFLENHTEFTKEKITINYNSLSKFIDNDGSIQFLPDNDGMEGFYICQMRKK